MLVSQCTSAVKMLSEGKIVRFSRVALTKKLPARRTCKERTETRAVRSFYE